MKKRFFPFLLALSMFLPTGCTGSDTGSDTGSNNAAPQSDAIPVEIRVVTSYGSDDGNRKNYENAFAAYEATTGNTVIDNSGISNEEWKAGIMSDFATGNEPDVLFYFTGADSDGFIKDGKVVSIDEIRTVYPDYASNMDENLLAKSPVDGKNYAVPVNGYWEGLFVNKKVLDDCGIDVPGADTTWEEFLADCQTIADKGYVPIAASLNEVPHYWFEFCVLNSGTVENHAVLPTSSTDDVGAVWTAGINEIKELYNKGFFPPNTITMSGAESDALMAENKAAFMIDGSWKIGWFAENAMDINNFTVTYVPGKGQRKPTDIIGGLSMGYYITAKAWDNPEKREACVKFVSAMTSDEVVETFGVTAVNALKNKITPPDDANSLVKAALDMTGNVTGVYPATADGLLPNSRSYLFENIKNIVTGDMTAEEAIDNCLSD